ncbi:GntP family permease [Echinicola vietnamensis]|uniref:H+/gluconate symporter family protein n=1 Tax=Echinicola vietnamensis (strain DSM 17526 / LMG 23754 / KMM 6221) TaxID=926556 RepID=L0G579_ECHVK|nr:GntP family permease [Echinicola vietnamensis]AGA79980.1 H+/gluconate symporter family protein [Echinicola vietnamensis DSM 17526]
MTYLIALILSLAVLIMGIIKFKVHPFFMLLLAALTYGLAAGMSGQQMIAAINIGFGEILGKIGLIILFGVTIGTILEKSGGALVMANRILSLIGKKSIHLAMMVTGYVLSIPVFADSALMMMNPLNKMLSKKAGVSFAGTTAALAMGLTASHVMVPPTPGPIAAAGILEANLGDVIVWGLLISCVALVPCYGYAKKVADKLIVPVSVEVVASPAAQPPLWKSLLAILIPLLLILIKSVLEYPTINPGDSILVQVLLFLGTPVMALLVGVILSLMLPKKLDEAVFSSSGWIGESLKVAAPIILITGAGGIFGKMLQESGLAEAVTAGFEGAKWGLFVPFLLAACLKTTQGSSTVALVTTASICAPLMPFLGLDEGFMRTMTVLAIGAGSSVASHVNDSFFWVLTQLTGMNVKQGYQVQTAGTFVFGCSAMIVIYVITKILA